MAADVRDVGRRPIDELTREVARRYGLSLRECTPEGVAQRLRFRIQDRALDGVDDYAEYLLYSGDGPAWEDLVETLTGNESRIFGTPADFTPLFEIESDPRWAHYARAAPRPETFRCLSAACGTGEEAYSLAIALAEAQSRAPALSFEVLGVDLSARAVGKARRAAFPASRAWSLPDDLRSRYLEEREEGFSAERLRPFVRFARLNLCEPGALSPLGAFDLILARDFLPALTVDSRERALRNLGQALRPCGVLVLGAWDSPGEPDLGLVPTRWGDRYAYERPGDPAGPGARLAAAEEAEPMSALVAHRSPLVRSWMRILLEQAGYRVEEAADGVRALERAVMGRPRALHLLELTLPAHGGPALAESLERLGVPRRSVAYLSPRDPAAADAATLPAGARVLAIPLSGRDLQAALPDLTR